MTDETNTPDVVTIDDVTMPAQPSQGNAEATEGTDATPGLALVPQADYDALRAELDAFKRKTAEVAAKYADRHGMCTAIDGALGELGLRRPETTYRVTVDVRLTFDMPARNTKSHGSTEPTENAMWKAVSTYAEHRRYYSATDAPRLLGNIMSNVTTFASSATATLASDPATTHLLPAPVVTCDDCDDCGTVLDQNGYCTNDC